MFVFGCLSDVYYLDGFIGFYLIDSLIVRDYGVFMDMIKYLILFSIVLVMVFIVVIVRMICVSMVEVFKEDYVCIVKVKGCSFFRVIFVYILCNVLIFVMIIVGLMLVGFLGGSMIIEMVFLWFGIGKWIVNAFN